MFGKTRHFALVHLITLSVLASLSLAAPLDTGSQVFPIGPDAPVAPANPVAPADPAVPGRAPPKRNPYIRPPFDPKKLKPIKEYVEYPTGVPVTQPAPRASWWSKWTMPWSPDPNAVPTSTRQVNRLLQNPSAPLDSGRKLILNPVQMKDFNAIRLPGNGFSSAALEGMLEQQQGRQFYAAGENGKVYFVSPNRKAVEVGALTRNSVNYALNKPGIPPTVVTPTVTSSVARAGNQAKSGLGWMERLTQGAKSWFGSAASGLKFLKPV
ncbi:uncharacterized protein UTRI_04548_B [Ustilago trichophora]|uniref:Uncharacterized protein n=1 Tax=Ustilago trichophora TaxID=86804 RepID=A0A5C3EC16_9BASI|nr:uncharacterized protein UTRI_04548_B [Ustilago trichophora]